MQLLMGQFGALHYLLATGVAIVCFLLIIIILLQKGRGGGIASAFGGGGGNTAFGAKTGDVFTWITVGFAAFFLLLTVLGNYAFRPPVAQADKPLIVSSPESSDDQPVSASSPAEAEKSQATTSAPSETAEADDSTDAPSTQPSTPTAEPESGPANSSTPSGGN